MTFWGMDTEQGAQHAARLERAAGRLEELMSHLDPAVRNIAWHGPDADSFQDRWSSTRARAAHGANMLRADAVNLHRQASDQDHASEATDGGGASGAEQPGTEHPGSGQHGSGQGGQQAPDPAELIQRIMGGHHGVLDGVSRAYHSAFGAVSDYANTMKGNVEETARSASGLAKIATDAVTEGRWPRFTEVVAGSVDFGLDVTNTMVHAVTGHDAHLSDDGHGYADSPREVSAADSHLVTPRSMADIFQNTSTSYQNPGEVTMTVVGGAKPTGVIVNIPGTQTWNPRAGDNPLDLSGNAAQAGPNGSSAGSQATADAIAKLYRDNHIPPDTPLMLNGHSQGGMIATSLASNPEFTGRYHLTNVATYGSPTDNYSPDPSVRTLDVQRAHDAVPKLDVDGAYAAPGPAPFPSVPVPNPAEALANQNVGSGNATTATIPDAKEPWDVIGNHDHGAYVDSVRQQEANPSSSIAQWQQDPSMRPFLTDNPAAVRQYRASLHRRN